MNTLTTAIFLLLSAASLHAQKVRLEGDNSRYLCLNDSIAETFDLKLKNSKVDSIITILHDFDNGRLPDSRRITIWTDNGRSHIRLVEGCDKIKKDTTYATDLSDLWQYIKMTHFDDITVPIESGTGQSHDKFYHITVSTPQKTFFVVVRDNQRRSTPNYKTPETDARVMLTNKIDSLINR